MDNFLPPDKKKQFKRITEDVVGVLIAALLAGLFTFIQELAQGTGICPDPTSNVNKAGAIGASLKGGHAIIRAKIGSMFL